MAVSEVRFSDPYICRLVEEEQARRGDATPTKTAGRMISEYAALLRLGAAQRPEHDVEPSSTTPNESAA